MKNHIVIAVYCMVFINACKSHRLAQLPEFSFRLSDSITFVNSKDIPSGSPVVLFHFESDCRECQQTTDSLLKSIHSVKDVHFYFLSSEQFGNVIHFSRHYKMDTYPNVTVGQDYSGFLRKFFNNPHTPLIAIYNSNKELEGIYDRQPYVAELIASIHAVH